MLCGSFVFLKMLKDFACCLVVFLFFVQDLVTFSHKVAPCVAYTTQSLCGRPGTRDVLNPRPEPAYTGHPYIHPNFAALLAPADSLTHSPFT